MQIEADGQLTQSHATDEPLPRVAGQKRKFEEDCKSPGHLKYILCRIIIAILVLLGTLNWFCAFYM